MFPTTRHSLIAAAGAVDPDTRRTAFGTCVDVYWRPVCSHVRLRWHTSAEEAEEFTQAFFARAFEKNFLDTYDSARGRFRTFVRTCVDAFVANELQAASRLKRGGGARTLSLHDAATEREPALAAVHEFDLHFEREWARSILATSVDRLRQSATTDARRRQYAVFARYDLEAAHGAVRPTYASVAAELHISVSDVTNALFAARRDFRTLVLECLRQLTRSEEEFQSEARRLLHVEIA